MLQRLYTLAQCTPDLTPTDCTMCLQTGAGVLLRGSHGARYFNPSCTIRYETYVFYNETAVALLLPPPPAPAPQPPPSLVPRPKGRKISTAVIIALVTPIGVTVMVFIILCCLKRRRAAKRLYAASVGNDITNAGSLQFDFAPILAATEDFSANNKLGEGGFGEVFKGVLRTGQLIAVKRLSRSSGQGAEEFKNEVMVVAKLQHRNLLTISDSEKQGRLDWSRRYKIIAGIARGMLYLHEESRLRIIHRDLKTSNVLLDADMNPKIADFGMARIFGVDQTQGTTNKVVGTFGYMSPEYAMHGQFSVKSDVYSFGVLVLEIISGEKNSSFYQSGTAEDLPSHERILPVSYPLGNCPARIPIGEDKFGTVLTEHPKWFTNLTLGCTISVSSALAPALTSSCLPFLSSSSTCSFLSSLYRSFDLSFALVLTLAPPLFFFLS
ncbi:hypothetical protein CRG98_045115 [Punica granatum]|uniref:non-specific serine/threonine protein kinase n=1 Tax=Punica granatum TaxID=22663 RepID=A0A2I0HSB3_PUNGR|nr:hypothetical protein CRG98_045115 [Punica granatum]